MAEEELAHLPAHLRERASLVEEAVEEAPHPFIYRAFMEEGTRHVVEEYIRKKEALKSKDISTDALERLLGVRVVDKASIEELTEKFGSGELEVVGVDAGTNHLNLEIAHIPLCCAVAALCSGFDVIDHIPEIMDHIPLWDDELYPEMRTLVISYRLQFKLVVKAVRRWEPDIVLFDGPFLYSQLYRRGGRAYMRDFERTVEAGIRALDFCVSRGIPIVGFVKRPEGLSIAKKLVRRGILKKPVRDIIALKWLRYGSYTAPFRYTSRMEAKEAEKRHESRLVGSIMAEFYFKKANEMGIDEEVVSIVFTYLNTGYRFPYKIEVPEPFAKELDEIVALVFALRATRGLPFPIYAADSLTKVSNTTRDLFLLSLRARLAEEVARGRLSEDDIDAFLPRHGETYGLSEERFEKAPRPPAYGRGRGP